MTHIFIKFLKTIVFIAAYVFFASAVLAKDYKYDAFTVKITGKGQPILLIPGATCSGDEWNETVARYKDNYQCHIFTLAGYAGTAPLPNGPYLLTIKKEMEQYIIDQKLDNVILIGHSIGGFLSLCIASEMKAHLQKVLVVDALPFYAATFNPNAADTFNEKQAQNMFEMYARMDDKALKENQMKTAKFLCRDSTKWDMIATWGANSDRKTLAYTLAEMMGNDMRKKVGDVQVPVLILGAFCTVPEYTGFTYESVLKTYTEQYSACAKCTVHVANDRTKHFIMYDNPDWYFAEVDNFLKN